MPSKIYSYGAHFRSCPPIIDRLLRQSTRYYNVLVELENLRRAVFLGVEEDCSKEVRIAAEAYDSAEKRVDAAVEAISSHRAKTRERGVPVELAAEKKKATEARKVAAESLKQAKLAHRAGNDAANDEKLRRVTRGGLELAAQELTELSRESGTKLRALISRLKERHGVIGPMTLARLNREVVEAMCNEPEWPDAWKQTQRCEAIILQATKDARRLSGLPHGTYSLAEDALEAARKSAPAGDLRRKWVPRDDELPVDVSGRVGVQLMGGLSIPDLIAGKSNRLKLRVETEDELIRKGFGNKSPRWVRRNTRAIATLAVDSGDDGWVTLDIPISYHRPLPPNANIRFAWLMVSRTAQRLRYDLQLMINTPDEVDAGISRRAEACAVNLGWRHFDDGSIRVAYVVGTDGHHEELRIPGPQPVSLGATESEKRKARSIPERLNAADGIQAASDKLFDSAVDVLSGMISSNHALITEDIRCVCANISHWSNHAKLRRVVEAMTRNELWCPLLWDEWKRARLKTGDDLLGNMSEAQEFAEPRGYSAKVFWLYLWRIKDLHLEQFGRDLSRKAIRCRDDLFACWAKRLSERYNVFVFEDEGLKKRGEKEEPGKETVTESFRREMRRAAPGEFKAAIVSKVGNQRIAKVKNTNNSRTCVFCGAVDTGSDLAGDVNWRCVPCGKRQDQDHTNATNQLQRWRDR